jgi:DNA-binding SARP family transcriptional activator
MAATDPSWSVARLAHLSPAQAESVSWRELSDVADTATDTEISAHPQLLLHLARACEAGQRLTQRSAALDRLETLSLDRGLARQVAAERAIDAARTADLDEAEIAARAVLGATGEDDTVATARALEALGRVLAWRGDLMSAATADQVLTEVAKRYEDLGTVEWWGHVTFWHGNCVYYQRGDLERAEVYLRRGLEILPPDSPRRGTTLTFLADLLTMTGRWEEVEEVLADATRLATRHGDEVTQAYVAWSHAKVASLQGDASGTVRALIEAERHTADWFAISTGATFLAEAAELLDRVGEHAAADDYLERAQARDPHDEFVLQAAAALCARRGDPERALDQLRALTRAPWLEVRLTWRRTLLAAWATMRARRDGAASLAARALEEAAAMGSARIALIGEPAIAAALLPLAVTAGSTHAADLLAPAPTLLVRVLGEVSVRRAGEVVTLPSGQPGRVLRLLALHPEGLDVEQLVELLWPESDPDVVRRRLRDATSRLRSRSGELVVRDGTRLSLAPAWVDAAAVRAAAARALASRRDDAELAVSALALWTGDLLPTDPYESWASGPREQLRRRRLELLDVVAAEAARRGSLDEARATLEIAIEADPYDDTRYLTVARHLLSLGRRSAARRMLDRAAAVLEELGLGPTAELRDLLAAAREDDPRHVGG